MFIICKLAWVRGNVNDISGNGQLSDSSHISSGVSGNALNVMAFTLLRTKLANDSTWGLS